MSKTHWKNLANYDYLGAYSLEGITNEITVTINAIKKERVTALGGKTDDCIIAFFNEEEVSGVVVKPMVINKTNCQTLEDMYGPYIEEWVGKTITIFTTTTKFQRDTVPCLRIRNLKNVKVAQTNEATATATQQPQPEHECVVCKKSVDNRTYNAVMKAYGVSVCSKECYNKYLESNNKEENN